MGYCLPKFAAEDFKKALKAGALNPSELMGLPSAERRAIFERYMNKMQAQNTNALFESKLLLKNQQKGMISWAKKVSGITPETRRDLIAKVERLDRALSQEELDVFLEDLIEKRLGFRVTAKEAETIAKMADKVEEARVRIPDNAPDNSPVRLEYGAKAIAFRDYTNALKLAAKEGTLLSYLNPLKAADTILTNSKALNATGDLSVLFNQGVNLLFTNPDIFMQRAAGILPNVVKALRGKDVRAALDARIVSRKNYLNGKYETTGADLGVGREEGLPESLGEKIPFIKRIFKAADIAYNGFILEARADYADRVIKTAERFGLDMTDQEIAKPFGRVVNSLTGRGSLDFGPLGTLEPFSRGINVTLFSPKYWKSNIDILTFGLTDPEIAGAALKGGRLPLIIAATNTIKIMGAIAGLLLIADKIRPGSVQWDPKAANFGLNIDGTNFDFTGGKKSMFVFINRLASLHRDEKNERWVFSTTNTGGKTKDINTGGYGETTALDLAHNLVDGKMSPFFGAIRDLLRGEFYSGDPFTFKQAGLNLVTPITAQTAQKALENPDEGASFLAQLLASALGISVNTYSPK